MVGKDTFGVNSKIKFKHKKVKLYVYYVLYYYDTYIIFYYYLLNVKLYFHEDNLKKKIKLKLLHAKKFVI